MEVVDDMNAEESLVGWSHVGICRSTCRVRGDAMMTHSHTVVQVRSFWQVVPELVGLPGLERS